MIIRDIVLDRFDVDIENGRLFWKKPPKNHARLLGTEAGHARHGRHGKFYWVVKIDKKAWTRGHLIFLVAEGRLPRPTLDHKDGNSLNDARSNLREATIMQNAWNHHKRARTQDLPMGVRHAYGGKYQSRITVNHTQITLGTFTSVEEAHAVYQEARRMYYADFA